MRKLRSRAGFALIVAGAIVAAATGAAAAIPGNSFTVTSLVSTATDASLVNAWGLTAGPATPWWVADNGTGVSTLYNGSGVKVPRTFTVGEDPTGTVFNGTGAFAVDGAPAAFIFDTEGGQITAWQGTTGTMGTTAQPIPIPDDGAVFKGLAIAQTTAGPRLYATDFHNGRVDVFDGSFQRVNRPFAFFDPTIPRTFAPFGIQTIGNRVYVTYAKKPPPGSDNPNDEVHGTGFGFVDAFDAATGLLRAKVALAGRLNAPWGLAQAPAGFGRFGGDLLVGNFGDGTIDAYAPVLGGHFFLPLGQLRTAGGSPLAIDGLWALQFGMGNANSGPTSTLFFTAGPADESLGLFGTITSG
ncbi:MAG TPA: TIGR03118 family protein [Gaiellaceae bacterium]|jgi:uncharacterized protein (TIGR03118 family)